jgi:hypothetical protein
MEIPNLAPDPSPVSQINSVKPVIIKNNPLSVGLIIIISVLAITSGFWGSRFFALNNNPDTSKALIINPETIKSKDQIEVGKLYGNLGKIFKDSATGDLEKGSINGEGTHILNRPGGLSQRASLTSSVVDLDLFVGRRVEIKGETNASNKTSWLLDVGTIKVLE